MIVERFNLGEICTFVRGLTYAKKDEVVHSGNAVIRATNINLFNHMLTLDEIRYISDSVAIKDNKRATKGDVLICTASGSKAHLGKVALVKENLGMAFGGFMAAIRPIQTCLPEYLYLVLISEDFKLHLRRISDGANINNLKFSQIENFEISLPPIPEQQRIIAILDQAFADIEKARVNAEKNLNNARELFDSYLNQMFSQRGEGWVEVTVKKVLSLEYGKPLDRSERKEKGLYPVYGANGIKARSDKYYCDVPSIIVGRKGSAGELTMTEDRYWPLDVTYFVKFDKDKYDLKFLLYMLSRLNMPSLATGVKPGINRNKVYAKKVFVPPLDQQKIIAKKLDYISKELDNLQTVYSKKNGNLNELKKSLLQKAFLGELTKTKGHAA